MVRSRPPDRLRHIIDGASRVFLDKGYKRALMADVAAAVELAPGTLYGYVESKEALFHLCLLPDLDLPATPPPASAPPFTETLDALRHQLRSSLTFETLHQALVSPTPDAVDELRTILREVYVKVEALHRVIALIERSAVDIPELRDIFYTDGRRLMTDDLASYIQLRMDDGGLRRVDDPQVAALLLREGVSWFAYHRHFDLDSRDLDDRHLPDAVLDLLVGGLAPL